MEDNPSNRTQLNPSVTVLTLEQTDCQTHLDQKGMSSCDNGLISENMHDLQRHIKTWCPENGSIKRNRDEEDIDDQPPTKKIKPDGDHDDREHRSLTFSWRKPNKTTMKMESEILKKNIKEGMTRVSTRIKTEEKCIQTI